MIAMSEGGIPAEEVMSVFSVVGDALTRRALDLTIEDAGDPPARFSWLILGSQTRREAVPSSDLDSAIVWFDDDGADEESIQQHLGTVATRVTDLLVRCGFRPDEHRATVADPLFVRSLTA